jgi:hypothetical protein
MLALLPLTALLAVSSSDEAVAALNREACVDGTLQLTPDRGELIDSSRMPNIAFFSDVDAKPKKVTYVRMKQPSKTFLMIETYAPGPSVKFETVCKVASRNLSQEAAEKAFFDGIVGKPKVFSARDGGHPNEPYVIDQPEAGLRKRLYAIGDWVMIETAIYAQQGQ